MSDSDNGYMPDRETVRGVMTNFKIDGKPIYNFNQKTGVLQVSASQEDINAYLRSLGFPDGKIPEGGIEELILPTPFFIEHPARFKCVKKIESMPGVKEGEYFLRLEAAVEKP